MSAPLIPCSGCQRHVLVNEAACPFCSTTIAVDAASRIVPAAPAPNRLTRAAMFTFATALTVAACGGTSTTEGATDGGASDGATTDGGAKTDGSTSDAGPKDDGGIQAAYGLPPPDAGFDAGNVQPPYGLPPMDAGPSD